MFWREAVVAYLYELTRYSLGHTEVNKATKIVSEGSRKSSRDSKRVHPETTELQQQESSPQAI
jgi:hypothetical protein